MSETRRRLAAVAVVCGVAAIGAMGSASAPASSRASARSATSAATARCQTAHLEIWLGLGLGGGTAGSTFYPLEFSNVGRNTCTLNGFPGVSAVGRGGAQLGPAASRNNQHYGTVTLASGATAHAILRVIDAGAVCSSPMTASSLKVFPPGATRSQPIPFSFPACAQSGVLVVGPVRPGVGVPGFTTS